MHTELVADVTVLLENGVAYPPFYFVQGGVHEFLTSVKDRLPLKPAPNDPDLFLIDEQSIKLNRSMETLLPESKDKRPVQPIRTKSVADRVNEASWSLLEGFARVANFSLSGKLAASGPTGAQNSQNVPSSLSAVDGDFELINDSHAKLHSPEAMPVPPAPAQASLPRGPVTEAVWRSQFDADGVCSPANEKLLRSRIFVDVRLPIFLSPFLPPSMERSPLSDVA